MEFLGIPVGSAGLMDGRTRHYFAPSDLIAPELLGHLPGLRESASLAIVGDQLVYK